MSLVLGEATVTVDPPLTPVVVTPPPAVGAVVVVPVAGPVGPRGATGGDVVEYVQSSPAATWTIVHGLGGFPSITLFLDDEPTRPVITDADYPDDNTVVLTFPSPVSGRAYL